MPSRNYQEQAENPEKVGQKWKNHKTKFKYEWRTSTNTSPKYNNEK